MKEKILERLQSKKTKRFSTIELEKEMKQELGENKGAFFYRNFGQVLIELEIEGVIRGIKSSKRYPLNAKLFNKYQLLDHKAERDEELVNMLLVGFHPSMSTSIYLKDANRLANDFVYLEKISSFLNKKTGHTEWISLNERSYSLFGDEKYLASEAGQRLLRNVAITSDDLCAFKTFEPFFYFRKPKTEIENILIVENKDTFFSLKRLMLEGITRWDDLNFSILIYGEGGKITKSIDFMEELDIDQNVSIYYYGDLDPEGIGIYHRTKKRTTRKIFPFTLFYEALWERRNEERKWDKHRCSQEAFTEFFSHFPLEWSENVREFLNNKGCVPQEGVHLEVLRRLSNGA